MSEQLRQDLNDAREGWEAAVENVRQLEEQRDSLLLACSGALNTLVLHPHIDKEAAISYLRAVLADPAHKVPFRNTPTRQAVILTLGWIVGKHGMDEDPVRWLAHALTMEGEMFPHLKAINDHLLEKAKNGK